jgi:hypothetical protein
MSNLLLIPAIIRGMHPWRGLHIRLISANENPQQNQGSASSITYTDGDNLISTTWEYSHEVQWCLVSKRHITSLKQSMSVYALQHVFAPPYTRDIAVDKCDELWVR